MELSQWLNDLIGALSFFLFYLPLLLLFLLCVVLLVLWTNQDEHLKKDYLRRCTPEEKKIIEDYIENTSYLRVRRRMKRIKKNFNNNK